MSGQQIGTVIGGVIGAFFGGPAGAQLGMAIGGLVGGAIDPEKIDGPRIGDGQQQTATDGSPIAWVMGTATIAGTVVQVGPRKDVKIKDSGKGGPTVTHHEARQSFAILICESSETRNSTIQQVIMVEQDGKIVWDMRSQDAFKYHPGDDLPFQILESMVRAQNGYGKWSQNIDFLYGPENQLPHPTLEALTGVGNTPSYRGVALMVAKDFNVTAAGDRIPQFRFTVSSSTITDAPIRMWQGLGSGSYYDLPTLLTRKYDPVYEKQFIVLQGGGQIGTETKNVFADSNLPRIPNIKIKLLADPNTRLPMRFLLSHGEIGKYGATEWDDHYGYLNGERIDPNGYILWDSGWIMAPDLIDDLDAILADPDFAYTAYDVLPLSELRSYSGGSLESPYITLPMDSGQILRDPWPSNPDWIAGIFVYVITQPVIETMESVDVRNHEFTTLAGFTIDTTPTTLTLAEIVTRICMRGGLQPSDIDVAEITDIMVAGYPIARQCSASDALFPLLQSYFCYASEYDGQIHFRKYGSDAVMVIAEDDLIRSDDANDNNSKSEVRNQATEFPRKITAAYMDPKQNYMVVNVSSERLAADVVAIGEQPLSIPVVMEADEAKRAVDKAMKVAYATLEGTQEIKLPFAGIGGVYLSLCAGEAVIFRNKRWVIDDSTLGNGYMALKLRYDRQSAYTSNVQAIRGSLPSLPPNPAYSGPTTLYAMNLPRLRVQDSVGLYLAAAPESPDQTWIGCQVQISYDNQLTWVNAVQIIESSTLGVVQAAAPLTVDVNDDLFTITDDQLAAQGNAFVILHTDNAEIGQFKTAAEDATVPGRFVLTDTVRGGLGTLQQPDVPGEKFTMLDSVYFLPIDPLFNGKTLYLRAVGFGEVAEQVEVISIVYLQQSAVVGDPTLRISATGDSRIDVDGNLRESY